MKSYTVLCEMLYGKSVKGYPKGSVITEDKIQAAHIADLIANKSIEEVKATPAPTEKAKKTTTDGAQS